MSDDIRVLLVKLADRLHNMRTLHHITKPEKRRRIARETMDIYAPLAERIGMYEFMKEMQTLAFEQLEPEAYESITRRLDAARSEGGGDRSPRSARAQAAARRAPGSRPRSRGARSIPIRSGRRWPSATSASSSSPTSWRSARSCRPRRIATARSGIIHRRWPMVPGRFKDYISTPKRNGYRSLHTSVIHADNTRVEIQIRTAEMHARGRVRPRRALGLQAGQGPARHARSAGSATWSRSSTPPTAPRSCSSTPGWRCTRTASSPSPRRAS